MEELKDGEDIPKGEEKKKTDYSKQGKKNRAAGRRFEAKVRQDLEKDGWIIAKWMNNVDIENIFDEKNGKS